MQVITTRQTHTLVMLGESQLYLAHSTSRRTNVLLEFQFSTRATEVIGTNFAGHSCHPQTMTHIQRLCMLSRRVWCEIEVDMLECSPRVHVDFPWVLTLQRHAFWG